MKKALLPLLIPFFLLTSCASYDYKASKTCYADGCQLTSIHEHVTLPTYHDALVVR